MATFSFDFIEDYYVLLEQLSESETIRAVCGETIYAGADVMADAIRKEIDALPVDPINKIGSESEPLVGINKIQKKGLQDSFGITPIQRDGWGYNVKLGFDGYNEFYTEEYPGGQPNSLIARSVNSGTYFRKKNPFIDRAIRSAKKETEAAMVAASDRAFKKLTKGR